MLLLLLTIITAVTIKCYQFIILVLVRVSAIIFVLVRVKHFFYSDVLRGTHGPVQNAESNLTQLSYSHSLTSTTASYFFTDD